MKLSVIIPCYNAAGHLPLLTRSLRANLRRDFEFVFVDDGSTDDTAELLAGVAADLPGATVLRHEHNRGVAAARNTGLARAAGRYLVWLDADDWVGSGHLDALVRTIERLGCDFVRTDHVRVVGRRRSIVRSPESRRDLVVPPRSAICPPFRSTSVDYPPAWAGIYHRRLAERGLLGFAENLHAHTDRHWTWRLHRGADSFATVGLPGVFHRHGGPDSLSRRQDAHPLHLLDAMTMVIAETADDPEAARLLPKAVDSTCALITHQLNRRDRLPVEWQQRLVDRSAATLRGMPQPVLRQVLAQGSPRRRRLLTRTLRAGA